MKKILLLGIVGILISESFLAQSEFYLNVNKHSKYWYYRYRLDMFRYVGDDPGESLVAQVRGRADIEDGINFGDGGVFLGWYIGVLATEYRLLLNSGDVDGLETTKRELYYALKAYGRIDHIAETADPFDKSASLNGYFTRDDAPEDFIAGDPTGMSESQLRYEQVWDHYTGLERSEFLNSDGSDKVQKYETGSDWISDMDESYEGPDPANVDEFGKKRDRYGTEPSQDQYIHVMMGMALVMKYIDWGNETIRDEEGNIITSYNFHKGAKDYMNLMLNYIRNSGFFWKIKNPRGHMANPGGFVYQNKWGFMQTGCKWVASSDYWCGLGGVAFSTNPWWQVQQRIPQEAHDAALVVTLAAISDGWRATGNLYAAGVVTEVDEALMAVANAPISDFIPTDLFNIPIPAYIILSLATAPVNTTKSGIKKVTKNHSHMADFYLLLWKALHDKGYDYYDDDDNDPGGMLDDAPCEGPYSNVAGRSNPSGGWTNVNKFKRHLNEVEGFNGEYNGLDYMLLHNLYYLTYEGSLPTYTHMIDKHITGEITGNKKIHAFGNLAMECKVKSGANVHARGGESYVELLPGFEVEVGGIFEGKAEPYKCEGGGASYYKSSNEPDIENEENYLYGITEPQETMHHAFQDFNVPDTEISQEEWENIQDYYFNNIVNIENSVVLYPNPAQQEITVYIAEETSKVKISVTAFSGKLLMQKEYSDINSFKLDISTLANGVYLVLIDTDENTYREKIMKE